jgi:hypothetical protein
LWSRSRPPPRGRHERAGGVDSPGPGLWGRYRDRFPDDPVPLQAWNGSEAGLERLMAAAIRRGRALTLADLAKAQGLEEPPRGAVW